MGAVGTGVKVKLGCQADSDLIARERFDAVVLATGAAPVYPNIPGIDGENVYFRNL